MYNKYLELVVKITTNFWKKWENVHQCWSTEFVHLLDVLDFRILKYSYTKVHDLKNNILIMYYNTLVLLVHDQDLFIFSFLVTSFFLDFRPF